MACKQTVSAALTNVAACSTGSKTVAAKVRIRSCATGRCTATVFAPAGAAMPYVCQPQGPGRATLVGGDLGIGGQPPAYGQMSATMRPNTGGRPPTGGLPPAPGQPGAWARPATPAHGQPPACGQPPTAHGHPPTSGQSLTRPASRAQKQSSACAPPEKTDTCRWAGESLPKPAATGTSIVRHARASHATRTATQCARHFEYYKFQYLKQVGLFVVK